MPLVGLRRFDHPALVVEGLGSNGWTGGMASVFVSASIVGPSPVIRLMRVGDAPENSFRQPAVASTKAIMLTERRYDFQLRALVEQGRSVRRLSGLDTAAVCLFRYAIPMAGVIRRVE